jgi:hypothetical protein
LPVLASARVDHMALLGLALLDGAEGKLLVHGVGSGRKGGG